MGVLAVYDTIGIQEFIFSSNKLAENVGASKLVTDIFAETLPRVIARVSKEDIFRWKDHRNDPLSDSRAAEIIYQGGGNAYVAFQEEPLFQSVTEEFLTQVSREARGVGIAVAAVETDFKDTYKTDFNKLDERLALVKGGFHIPVFAGNQPITKQSGRTGLPVSYFQDEEYLCESQILKRNKNKDTKEAEETRYIEFDDLTFEKGVDSLIALIYADGNNMAYKIKEHMAAAGDSYDEAVPKIRQLSYEIDHCYEFARQQTRTLFEAAYAKYRTKWKKEHPLMKCGDENPPLLELIGDGDDMTIVICGRFALDFAVRLLREIEQIPDAIRPSQIPLTACAGVVLFHSHYPFAHAYKLAEELCASAKKHARRCDRESSFVDFHLHQSGGVSDLATLRNRLFKVDSKTILRRPWRVSTGSEDIFPDFREFERAAEDIKRRRDPIPRNKIIGIRNAISEGDANAELAINLLRDMELPDFTVGPEKDDSGKTIMSNHAALFDVLEMLDAYETLLNKRGDSHDQ